MIEQVGRYRVVGNLGRGAMGVVLLAEDPLLNRRVAIKTLDFSVDDPGRRSFLHDRLLRDARAAAGLTHPNIVGVFDVVEQEDRAYLVMEYVPGQNLAQVLSAGPPPEPAFIERVLREMAAALDYTHARGVIHRDVKPSNVMLDAHGNVKIMDFGIARISDTLTNTPTGTVMGTIEYMAPEQVMGGAVDARADQFSLAAVAYELLTGKTLFGRHSFATLAYKMVHESPVAARTHRPGLPPGVDEVLAKALRKTPGERYASCREFVAALERALSGEVPASGATTQVMAVPGRKRRAMPLIAAVVAACVLGAAAFTWRPWAAPGSRSEQAPPKPEPTGRAVVRKLPAAPQPDRPSGRPKPAPSKSEPPPEPAGPSVPEAAFAAYKEGNGFLKSEQLAAAAESFSKAIQVKPDYAAAYAGRAQVYMRQNQLEDAIGDLSEAIRRNPRLANAFTLRGRCYLRQKQDDAAMADFTRSLELSPTALALDGRGIVYLNRNEYQKAIADFTAAIQMVPDFLPAYMDRHKAYIATGDRAAAKADHQKIQQLNAAKKSAHN